MSTWRPEPRGPGRAERKFVDIGGARQEAETRGIPYLGSIPLDIQIRATSDEGRPIVAVEPDSVHARHYIGIAREVWAAVASGAASKPAPRIIIE